MERFTTSMIKDMLKEEVKELEKEKNKAEEDKKHNEIMEEIYKRIKNRVKDILDKKNNSKIILIKDFGFDRYGFVTCICGTKLPNWDSLTKEHKRILEQLKEDGYSTAFTDVGSKKIIEDFGTHQMYQTPCCLKITILEL